MRVYRADLHIHTCLSPCADITMSPAAIVSKVKTLGLDMFGICDHNSSENAAITWQIASYHGITVFPGMEVTSQEEVHLLALFDTVEQSLTFQEVVYAHLPDEENDEDTFGYQLVVNEHDEILAFNKRLLIGATDLSIEEIENKVHTLNGLLIPSHIDRDHFSIVSQLGFIPDHIDFDALELSSNITLEEAEERFSMYHHLPWLFASDAHHIEAIGSRTTQFILSSPTIKTLKQTLRAGKEQITLL